MVDSFTETTTKGWGSRIMDSIKGILFWVILFFASFVLLYWNEWRVDISKVAKTAVEIDSVNEASIEENEKLVSTTWVLKSEEKLGDIYLNEWDYLALTRKVEMFAWSEKSESKTKKNVWWSETTETTYTYKKEWTSFPSSSSDFKKPEWHSNPSKQIDWISKKVWNLSIWIYWLDWQAVELPWYSNLVLNKENAIVDEWFNLSENNYIYKWSWSVSTPVVWDIRISYSVLENPIQNATVFWKLDLDNKLITPFYWTKDSKLYRAFVWTRDTAIGKMKTEHKIITWWLRILGFVMMWIWLNMLLWTISVILDVLPFLWSISRTWIWIVTFLVALSLSVITIVVSMIIHNLIALIVVVVMFLWLVFWYLKKKKIKK